MEINAYKVIEKVYQTLTQESGEVKTLDKETLGYIVGMLESILQVYEPLSDQVPSGKLLDKLSQKFGTKA